ncbi:hypothetical protein Tco_0286103 [Tanacetum coccineum]
MNGMDNSKMLKKKKSENVPEIRPIEEDLRLRLILLVPSLGYHILCAHSRVPSMWVVDLLGRLSVMDKYLAEFDTDLRSEIKGPSCHSAECVYVEDQFKRSNDPAPLRSLYPVRVAAALAQDRFATEENTNGASGPAVEYQGKSGGQGSMNWYANAQKWFRDKKKVEAYLRGLPENIKGETTSSRPVVLNEAVRMAHTLMEQKLQAKAKRIAESNKRK